MFDALIVNQNRTQVKNTDVIVFVLLLSHHMVSKLQIQSLHNQEKSFWFLFFRSFFVANNSFLTANKVTSKKKMVKKMKTISTPLNVFQSQCQWDTFQLIFCWLDGKILLWPKQGIIFRDILTQVCSYTVFFFLPVFQPCRCNQPVPHQRFWSRSR